MIVFFAAACDAGALRPVSASAAADNATAIFREREIFTIYTFRKIY
jgi:hypothetical protein